MTRDVLVTGLGAVAAPAASLAQITAQLAAWQPSAHEPPPWITTRPLQTAPARADPYAIAAVHSPPESLSSPRWKAVADDLGLAAYRDLLYAASAIRQALDAARLPYDQRDNRLGVVLCFEAPGMERLVVETFAAADSVADRLDRLADAFYRTQSFLYTHAIGRAFNLHGFSTCINNACSTGLHALDLAANHIRSGRADAMIVAGGEAFDTGVRPAYFQRLGFLSPSGHVRPFARPATGFVVGEGAGAFVLELAAAAHARGAPALAVLHPAAFAQQSWKQTLPNLHDRRLQAVIQQAVRNAGLSADQIDLSLPHGAATAVSDAYETDCLRAALGRLPPACAFKGLVGHLLAASALVDLAVALAAWQSQTWPPAGLCLADAPAQPIRSLLKFATGFTGHDAAVVLTRPSAA